MRNLFAAILFTGLAACTGADTLAPGLTARMDAPGAELDRVQALMIVNQYRMAEGAAPLSADSGLDELAQKLASQYAATGQAPKKPAEAAAIRVSAGYANFAETFSGWRNARSEASALAHPGYRRAGIGVAYSANSAYGVHWVMLFAEDTALAAAQ